MNKPIKSVAVDQLKEGSPFPGMVGKFTSSKEMSFVYWRIAKGTALPVHSHIHEQVAHVLAGEYEMTIDGQTQILKPGTVTVIPSNAVHSGRAVTDCHILDAFCPVREDYLKYE